MHDHFPGEQAAGKDAVPLLTPPVAAPAYCSQQCELLSHMRVLLSSLATREGALSVETVDASIDRPAVYLML